MIASSGGSPGAYAFGKILNHPPGNSLCKKIRAFQVYVDQPVKALFSRVEQVSSHLRANAGIVDEQVKAGELVSGKPEERRAVGLVRNVRAKRHDPGVLPAGSR